MKWKSLALLCILSLIISGCNFTSEKNTTLPKSSTTESSKLLPQATIDEQKDMSVTVSYEPSTSSFDTTEDKSIHMDVFYLNPIVSIDFNSDAQDAIMSSLKKKKKIFDDSIHSLKANGLPMSESDTEDKSATNISQTYETKRCDNEVISLCEHSSVPSSKPDKGNCYYGLNYDSRSGKELTLHDITSDDTKMLDSAYSYIISQLKLPRYADQLNIQEDKLNDKIYSDILTDGNWFFSNAGLTFISNVDTLTSASMGTTYFTVPYHQLTGLKADYQYLGPFEQSGPLGSTLSADLDGNESVDAVYFDSSYNNDTASCTFTINGKDYSSVLKDNLPSCIANGCNDYYLVDLDISDSYIEIAILDSGYTDDATTNFFRYKNGDVTFLGTVQDYISNWTCKTYGDGTISAAARKDLVEYTDVLTTYQLKGETIEEQSMDWYPIVSESYLLPQHGVKSNLTVYKDKDLDSKTVTLTPDDGPVTFSAQDSEHWVQVQTKKGCNYYIYLDSPYTLNDGRQTSDVFDGIIIAD